MERKKASDCPQEVLDLIHERQHGPSTGDRSSTARGGSPWAG